MSCFIAPRVFRGRQAVQIGNDRVCITVMCGGGHIALIQSAADSAKTFREEGGDGGGDEEHAARDHGSPLWLPPWPTYDPALSATVPEEIFGAGLEGKHLLSHICGHNLCLDVFGAHSEAESTHAGRAMSFHGEAGQATWDVAEARVADGGGEATLVLEAHLRHTQLSVRRTFQLRRGECSVKVTETMRNLVGFQRALGRAQHVTFGAAFLRDHTTSFTTNCDAGRTWPDALGPHASFEPATDFSYPALPACAAVAAAAPGGRHPEASMGPAAAAAADVAAADGVDWREYPRGGVARSEGLCTMRVDPKATAASGGGKFGWMLAHNRGTGVALSYVWERETFPWLMTWEENNARMDKPWNGRTLTRGLEISSYAFALGRKANVEMGALFDTPTFEWLDAHEEKTTRFYISLQQTSASAGPKAEPIELSFRPAAAEGQNDAFECAAPGMEPVLLR